MAWQALLALIILVSLDLIWVLFMMVTKHFVLVAAFKWLGKPQ